MIISISQPTVFPWLGYFDIIKKSDVFVFLDTVKFEKRSWQMRNRLKMVTKDKEHPIWINIPTHVDDSFSVIKDVQIDNSQKWKTKHLRTFESLYGKHFRDIKFLIQMYERDWEKLTEFNISFITECCKYLNIKTKLLRASDLNIVGKKSHLLLNICKKLLATEYLTTIGSKEYLENDKMIFKENNIEIIYHNYTHPIYKQKGKTFIDKLSILDLLLNEKENASKFFS